MTNTSDTLTYGVAFPDDPGNNVHLSNAHGDEFTITDLEGIKTCHENNGTYHGYVTDIPPGRGIVITSKSQNLLRSAAGDYHPYRLQTVVFFGELTNGHYNLRPYNLLLDIK
jgi:hypothetical protein